MWVAQLLVCVQHLPRSSVVTNCQATRRLPSSTATVRAHRAPSPQSVLPSHTVAAPTSAPQRGQTRYWTIPLEFASHASSFPQSLRAWHCIVITWRTHGGNGAMFVKEKKRNDSRKSCTGAKENLQKIVDCRMRNTKGWSPKAVGCRENKERET